MAIDYTIQTNPLAALAGFGAGMDMGQQRQNMALAASQEQRAQEAFDVAQEQGATQWQWAQDDRAMALQDRERALAEQDQERARALEWQADAQAMMDKAATAGLTMQDIAEMSLKYPEQYEPMKEVFDGLTAERRKGEALDISLGYNALKSGNPQVALDLLDERIEQAKNADDAMAADQYQQIKNLIAMSPEAALVQLGSMLYAADEKMAEAVLKGDGAGGGDRFKVVGGQLVDTQAPGGPKPVEGVGDTQRGPEWVDLTPTELAQYGFVFGQRNTKTGKVEGEKPPKGQTIELGADGSLVITDGAGMGSGGKPPTEGQLASAGYLSRMIGAQKIIDELATAGTEAIDLTDTVAMGTRAEPYKLTPPEQKLVQAQRDWVRAKLRKESGAVIGDEEMAEEIRTYFPQPGDSPEVIAQKRESRKAAEKQMQITSGGAADKAGTLTDGAGGSGSAPSATDDIDALLLEADGL